MQNNDDKKKPKRRATEETLTKLRETRARKYEERKAKKQDYEALKQENEYLKIQSARREVALGVLKAYLEEIQGDSNIVQSGINQYSNKDASDLLGAKPSTSKESPKLQDLSLNDIDSILEGLEHKGNDVEKNLQM